MRLLVHLLARPIPNELPKILLCLEYFMRCKCFSGRFFPYPNKVFYPTSISQTIDSIGRPCFYAPQPHEYIKDVNLTFTL